MHHGYRKATLLASAAALAGFASAGATSAGVLSWLTPWSGDAVANHGTAAGKSTDPLPVASRGGMADGDYTGPAVDAYYGLVQVRATIRGGRLVSLDVLRYPADRRTSRYINSQALPMLQNEVIQAQSARVYAISGATLTSRAFLSSLDSALRQAGA